jgi:hypothetical protein
MKSLLLSVALSVLFMGCSGSAGTAPASPATPTPVSAASPGTVVYTCSMHPEVQSDKPGKCPKCNMDLIIKK